MTTVTPKVENLAFDCADMDVMAAFWGALLDMEVTHRDERWMDLDPVGRDGLRLSFQPVPEPKEIKNRLHLDLRVTDIDAAEARVAELGATLADEQPGEAFRVWHDPEGNEFCLTW